MLKLIVFLLRLFLIPFHSKKELICENMLLKKEVEILRRQNAQKPIRFMRHDRVIISAIGLLSNNIKSIISVISPHTLLAWQKTLIKNFWTYKNSKKRGRPPVSVEIKNLICSIKNDNLFWGAKKICGELLKIGIVLSTTTIRNIIRMLRKQGKIKPALTWIKFLSAQAHSIYAADALTVDTVLNRRYYVHFIIKHATREIVQFAITQFPVRERIKQMMIELENSVKKSIYLIHDNSGEFLIDYSLYNIKGVAISAKAPNMNAIAERFVGSIRRECLDNFLIVNERQLKNIVSEYISYYNSMRTHQGINYDVPQGFDPQKFGKIRKMSILGGLHHHYYRKVA